MPSRQAARRVTSLAADHATKEHPCLHCMSPRQHADHASSLQSNPQGPTQIEYKSSASSNLVRASGCTCRLGDAVERPVPRCPSTVAVRPRRVLPPLLPAAAPSEVPALRAPTLRCRPHRDAFRPTHRSGPQQVERMHKHTPEAADHRAHQQWLAAGCHLHRLSGGRAAHRGGRGG